MGLIVWRRQTTARPAPAPAITVNRLSDGPFADVTMTCAVCGPIEGPPWAGLNPDPLIEWAAETHWAERHDETAVHRGVVSKSPKAASARRSRRHRERQRELRRNGLIP